MEQRLIDATPIENKLTKWAEELSRNFDDRDELNGVYSCLSEIQSAPTIDPESLRYTAHWECLGEAEALQLGSKYAASYCSRCRGRVRCRSDYCPHCGAKMEN